MQSSGVEDGAGTDEDVQDDLMRLSSRLVLLFGAMKPDQSNKNKKHASFTMNFEDSGNLAYFRSRLPPNPHEFHYIVINETYGHYLKHSQCRTRLRDQRTQWSSAITLVHELAPAYYARGNWTIIDD